MKKNCIMFLPREWKWPKNPFKNLHFYPDITCNLLSCTISRSVRFFPGSLSVVSLCSAFSPLISFPLNPNQAQQMCAPSSVWFCWKSLSVKRDFLLLTISSAYSYGVALLLLSQLEMTAIVSWCCMSYILSKWALHMLLMWHQISVWLKKTCCKRRNIRGVALMNEPHETSES